MASKQTDTLAEARDEVFTGMLRSKGAICPCCEQKAKLYKRQITSSMAFQLVCLSKFKTPDFVHVEDWRSRVSSDGGTMGGGEHSRLRFWDLIITNGKGGWRITDAGREFVAGRTTYQKFARIYNGSMYGFAGPQVSIHDCLGARYTLGDLMAA